jgi:ACT domain
MLLRARVSLLDRPGALLSVARVIADLGGNIVDIEILATGDGKVIDDLVLELPGGDTEAMIKRLGTTGAEVLNLRRTVRLSGQRPDLDLLHRVATTPDEALATLVSMAPPVWSADWAAIAEPGGATAVRNSPGAPNPLPVGLPQPIGALPRRGVVEGPTGQKIEVVGVPVGDYLFYLGRSDGPTFLQVELVQLRRVVELVATLMTR